MAQRPSWSSWEGRVGSQQWEKYLKPFFGGQKVLYLVIISGMSRVFLWMVLDPSGHSRSFVKVIFSVLHPGPQILLQIAPPLVVKC